jgi:hypothetical protein
MAEWPKAAELALILDVPNVADWQVTFDRYIAAAKDTVISVTGPLEEGEQPSFGTAAAVLRMAELMAQTPDASVESLLADASVRAFLSGRHKRFGIA